MPKRARRQVALYYEKALSILEFQELRLRNVVTASASERVIQSFSHSVQGL